MYEWRVQSEQRSMIGKNSNNLRLRLITWALIVSASLLITVFSAVGEHYSWDCPECGNTGNTGNYCGMCAHPAPWMSGEGQQEANSVTNGAPEKIDVSSFKVGDTIKFGHYEQDNNLQNGLESIEWMVLDVQDGKALMLSKYGLEAKPYNTESTSITWESCTLRKWLNGDFMDTAFSEQEKTAILKTTVDNSKKQGYSKWNTNGGNNTQDQVFLLSYAEANKYLEVTINTGNNLKSRVSPTDYAKAQGAYTSASLLTEDGSASGWWWLRSPGFHQNFAGYVNYAGSLHFSSVNNDDAVVRPAFWLDLKSEIF